MNLTNLSQTYFILLICILNEIFGTRIPLEIVQLQQSATQLTGDTIANTEYRLHDSEVSASGSEAHTNNDRSHTNEWRSSRTGRKLSTSTIEAKHEPRIFYQVGSSEDDLPVCGANEVCSKIDLYGTPWIERQCRCPSAKHYHTITINHDANDAKNRQLNRHAILHNLKLSEIGDNVYEFESEHIKSFLMKLGMLHSIDDNLMDDVDIDNGTDEQDDDDDANDLLAFNKVIGSNKHRVLNNGELMAKTTAKIRHHNNGHGHTAQSDRCSNAINTNDGYTIADKTRLYKVCEPVHKLPLCRYFRDYTWTLISYSDMNITQQIVHCRCPKNSISYLINREPLKTGALGYTYLFACSPQSRLKCQRKEPCKLFTVRKRQELLDEVNTNILCQCPRNYHCPKLHTDFGVVLGKSYIEDNIRTYSGYCMQDTH